MSVRDQMRSFSKREMNAAFAAVIKERLPKALDRRCAVIVYDRKAGPPPAPPDAEVVLFIPDNGRKLP